MSDDKSQHELDPRGFATRAIHAGHEPDPATGAVNVPIYASSTFAQDGVGGMRGGYEYARTGNPRARPSRPTSRRWRTVGTAGRSRPAWPLRTPLCGPCCAPATTS